MKVTKQDGCKVLRASGAEEDYVGAVTFNIIKHEIDADVCEICETIEGGCIVIDESGKLRNKLLNFKATHMYKYSFYQQGGRFLMYDYICGDVVYLPKQVYQRWQCEEYRKLATELGCE